MFQRSADRKAVKKNATKAIKKIVDSTPSLKSKSFSKVDQDTENYYDEKRSEEPREIVRERVKEYDEEPREHDREDDEPREREYDEPREREREDDREREPEDNRDREYEEETRERERERDERDYEKEESTRSKRAAPKERKPRDEEDLISKSSFAKLLKRANIQSATGDVLEAVKQIVPDFVSRALSEAKIDNRTITSAAVDNMINKWIAKGESEIVDVVTLSYDSILRPTLEAGGYVIKRDGYYQLIHFIETWLIKLLVCADIIAEANRRTRICGRDLSVAYTIKMQ